MNHDWDELASAYVDGEATEEEVALVERTPIAMAIVAEFRAVASANASVPAPGTELEDRQIAHALDLFDELSSATADPVTTSSVEAAPGGTPALPTNVTDLAARRSRRNGWLATAAAGFIVIAGFGVASSQLGGGEDDAGTESAEVAASPSAADASDADAETDGQEGRASALAGPASADDGADETGAGEDESVAEDDSAETEDAMEEGADDAVMSDEADVSTTIAAQAPAPLVELESGQDLFAAVDTLEADGIFIRPSALSEERLSFFEQRCPTELAELTEPIGIPILYGGRAADLFYDRSTPERVLIITSTCSILAADQRP